MLAGALIGSSDWYDRLWQRRDWIADKPALVLWGMRDPAFEPSDLERWRQALRNAHFVEFPDAGHFVQEEVDAAELGAGIRDLIARATRDHTPELRRMPPLPRSARRGPR